MMQNRPLFLLLSFFFISVLSLFCDTHKTYDKKNSILVISGVVPNRGSADLIDRFAAYLEKKTNYKLKPYFVSSYQELSNTLRQNKNAFALTCGAPYVKDSIRDGQQLIAVPLLNNKPLYHSFVIAKSAKKAKSLLDFEGKIFAYSDAYSNSGMAAPTFELKRRGKNINNYFRLMINSGNHENSIIAVNNGLADVAAVDEYVWIEYKKKNPEIIKNISVIESFGPYPFTPFVAGSEVLKKDIKLFQNILTNMHKTEEGKKILHSFGVNGFIIKDNSFYNPIKQMLIDIGKLDEKKN